MHADLLNKKFEFFNFKKKIKKKLIEVIGLSLASIFGLIGIFLIAYPSMLDNKNFQNQNKIFSVLGKNPEVARAILKDVYETTEISKNEFYIVREENFFSSQLNIQVKNSPKDAKITWIFDNGGSWKPLLALKKNNPGNISFSQSLDNSNKVVLELTIKDPEKFVAKFD